MNTCNCRNKIKFSSVFPLLFIPSFYLTAARLPDIHFRFQNNLPVCVATRYSYIYFTTMDELITKLRKDHESGSDGRRRGHHKSALVIVDEVGYTPIDREECSLFFRFIANRYEKASTIFTSNKAFSDWAELFHDPIIVTAILDRLLHHSTVINIKGNSFRLKEKREVFESLKKEKA